MEKQYTIENLTISSVRNVWGWYTADAFVNGFLISVKYDRKPRTKKQVKADLIERYNDYNKICGMKRGFII